MRVLYDTLNLFHLQSNPPFRKCLAQCYDWFSGLTLVNLRSTVVHRLSRERLPRENHGNGYPEKTMEMVTQRKTWKWLPREKHGNEYNNPRSNQYEYVRMQIPVWEQLATDQNDIVTSCSQTVVYTYCCSLIS